MKAERKILRVSDINRYVKGLLQNDPLLRGLWIIGEISNFKHHRSGHMYFTLKDEIASLRAVYFKRDNRRCPFMPEDGMKVIIFGNISVYEPDGVYQLYVGEMEPSGTGSLHLAFEQLKLKLEEEGLFKPEHKQKLPLKPEKIAIITSASGAALQDMLITIKTRFPYVKLLVVESLVQGEQAAADLVRALNLAQKRPGVDLIIMARGGGSLEDLWPFNEEVVARAVFQSKIPVISAVGHETDFTITDFVADLRAATPTAAAQAAVPDLQESLQVLSLFETRLKFTLEARLKQEKQFLDQLVTDRVLALPGRKLKMAEEELTRLVADLKKETKNYLRIQNIELASLIEKLDSASPLKIMNKGYSFCRNHRNEIVRSVKMITPGKLLELSFKDGRARCRAEELEEDRL